MLCRHDVLLNCLVNIYDLVYKFNRMKRQSAEVVKCPALLQSADEGLQFLKFSYVNNSLKEEFTALSCGSVFPSADLNKAQRNN